MYIQNSYGTSYGYSINGLSREQLAELVDSFNSQFSHYSEFSLKDGDA